MVGFTRIRIQRGIGWLPSRAAPPLLYCSDSAFGSMTCGVAEIGVEHLECLDCKNIGRCEGHKQSHSAECKFLRAQLLLGNLWQAPMRACSNSSEQIQTYTVHVQTRLSIQLILCNLCISILRLKLVQIGRKVSTKSSAHFHSAGKVCTKLLADLRFCRTDSNLSQSQY